MKCAGGSRDGLPGLSRWLKYRTTSAWFRQARSSVGLRAIAGYQESSAGVQPRTDQLCHCRHACSRDPEWSRLRGRDLSSQRQTSPTRERASTIDCLSLPSIARHSRLVLTPLHPHRHADASSIQGASGVARSGLSPIAGSTLVIVSGAEPVASADTASADFCAIAGPPCGTSCGAL